MVIFKIHVSDFALFGINTKGQPPVTRDVQAPEALPVSFQQVRFPYCDGFEFVWIVHVLQKSEHFAEFVHGIWMQALRDVLQIELFQALMNEVSYFQLFDCSLLRYTCQLFPQGFGVRPGNPASYWEIHQNRKNSESFNALLICGICALLPCAQAYSLRSGQALWHKEGVHFSAQSTYEPNPWDSPQLNCRRSSKIYGKPC